MKFYTHTHTHTQNKTQHSIQFRETTTFYLNGKITHLINYAETIDNEEQLMKYHQHTHRDRWTETVTQSSRQTDTGQARNSKTRECQSIKTY